jgi:hypothetical protein
MDPGYDEGDWELDIRRTQEHANTEVSQNRSFWFQRFLDERSSACHVGPFVECVESLRVDLAVSSADQSAFENSLMCRRGASELSASSCISSL